MDILCDIAGHLEDMKVIGEIQGGPAIESLTERVAMSLDELDDWWRGWITENPQVCYEIESAPDSTVILDDDGPLFPTVLQYTSLSAAYLVCTHNCGRILLLHLQRCLGVLATDPLSTSDAHSETVASDEHNKAPLLGICSDSRALAHEIMRSLDYCFEQAGGFMASFCVRVLQNEEYDTLDPGSREAEWLRKRDVN